MFVEIKGVVLNLNNCVMFRKNSYTNYEGQFFSGDCIDFYFVGSELPPFSERTKQILYFHISFSNVDECEKAYSKLLELKNITKL